MNPAHSVPVLVEGDFTLSDSHAIATYLVDTRSPGHSLYPSDRKTRALIDRYLYFEAGTVFPIQRLVQRDFIYSGADIDQERLANYREVVKIVEQMLDGHRYFVGDQLTLADVSIYSMLGAANVFDFEFADYPNIKAWLELVRSNLPFDDEINTKPVAQLKELALSRRAARTK